jgi:hypothetical protein
MIIKLYCAMILAMFTRLSFRRPVAPVLLLLASCLPAVAMERWAALSQLESGDNDYAVGNAGEVSRYQIKRDVWKRYADAGASWKNPLDSLSVAQGVMTDRCAAFERSFHRTPSDFEFYVLWNAPAQIQRPCRSVRERADRFCQLVRKQPPTFAFSPNKLAGAKNQ